MRKQIFNYEVGYKFYQYEIIDRISRPVSRGRFRYLYVLRCLKCGVIIEREEYQIDKEIKCRECMRRMEYSKYNIGDIVNGLEIIEKRPQFREKYNQIIPAYLCRCIKDGYESDHLESNLNKGKGCAVCAGNLIVKGINDINTIAPWLGELLADKNDGYKYGIGSKTKLRFKCPNCGTITKPTDIYSVYINRRIKCPKCSDGVSMPEKILYSMLDAVNEKFDYQKNFEWLNNRYYDFYIPNKNMIIETHGSQHYKNISHTKWDSLEEIQENDYLKRETAINNGIKNYLEIDCSDSSPFNLIKKYKNELKNYYDFRNIDENEIVKNAVKSFCIKTGDIWNDGLYDIDEISKLLKLNQSTIRTYLKILNKINYLNIPYPIKKQNTI